MNISETELRDVAAQNVRVTLDSLAVDLADGRTIIVPIAWFPRLKNGTSAECANWRFIGNRDGIHWSDLDEDISVASLLAGQRSGESANSIRQWLLKRKQQA